MKGVSAIIINSVMRLFDYPKALYYYQRNKLDFTIRKYSNQSSINELIPYLRNDKKNDDDKINFILLRNIGKTVSPNKSKISVKNLKNISKAISQY